MPLGKRRFFFIVSTDIHPYQKREDKEVVILGVLSAKNHKRNRTATRGGCQGESEEKTGSKNRPNQNAERVFVAYVVRETKSELFAMTAVIVYLTVYDEGMQAREKKRKGTTEGGDWWRRWCAATFTAKYVGDGRPLLHRLLL